MAFAKVKPAGGSGGRRFAGGCIGLVPGFGGIEGHVEILQRRRGELVLQREDDQHFLKLGKPGGRMNGDGGVGLVLGVGSDALDGADGKAAGVNLVAAGGEDGFTRANARIGGEVADLDPAGSGSAEDAADAGAGQDDSRPGSLIADKQEAARWWGNTSRSLPTMPSGVMTAMSGLRPASAPLLMRNMCDWSLPLVPMTCAATVAPM